LVGFSVGGREVLVMLLIGSVYVGGVSRLTVQVVIDSPNTREIPEGIRASAALETAVLLL